MVYNTIQDNTVPETFITINKGRTKIYGTNTVYLKDKQSFEIEIFNTKQQSILAKIKLNGKYISSNGIIIKPGQRIFLERFIDENKKFIFETYQVENNNTEVEKAILNNGLVEVEYYDEKNITMLYGNGSTISINSLNLNGFNTGSMTSINTTGTTLFSPSTSSGINQGTLTSTNSGTKSFNSTSSKETGSIEGGEKSNQSFKKENKEFNNFIFHKSTFHILPMSEKPLQHGDIKKFCTECGTNLKDSFKFCPTCGEKC